MVKKPVVKAWIKQALYKKYSSTESQQLKDGIY